MANGGNHHWQFDKATVVERNKFLLRNTLLSDATLTFRSTTGEVSTIPAHRFILATGSPFFENEIPDEITDTEPEAFMVLLEYFYTDKINLTNETAFATLEASLRYMVPQVFEACESFIISNLTPSNVLDQIELIKINNLYGEEELKKLISCCWKLIDAQTVDCFNSTSFLAINYDTLIELLDRDTLNCPELTIFKAVVKWTREKNGPNKIVNSLGDALNHIRIPLLTLDELTDAEGPVAKGLLSDADLTNSLLRLKGHNRPTRFINYPRVYASIERKLFTLKRIKMDCFSELVQPRDAVDAVDFVVDKKIFIAGFGIFGFNRQWNVKIALKEQATGLILAQKMAQPEANSPAPFPPQNMFAQVNRPNTQDQTSLLYFDRPVLIESGCKYTALICLGTSQNYEGGGPIHEISPLGTQNVIFQFTSSLDCTTNTDERSGQIPEILFYPQKAINLRAH